MPVTTMIQSATGVSKWSLVLHPCHMTQSREYYTTLCLVRTRMGVCLEVPEGNKLFSGFGGPKKDRFDNIFLSINPVGLDQAPGNSPQ